MLASAELIIAEFPLVMFETFDTAMVVLLISAVGPNQLAIAARLVVDAHYHLSSSTDFLELSVILLKL